MSTSRAEVFVEDAGVYLYEHHGASGDKTINAVRRGIERHRCTGTGAEYLAAMIFHEMARDSPGGLDGNWELGIGVQSYGHEVSIVVNCSSRTVKVMRHDVSDGLGDESGVFTFEEFTAQIEVNSQKNSG